jgi:hypothetical protein
MHGDLPPSSRTTGHSCFAAATAISFPTNSEPVKKIMSAGAREKFSLDKGFEKNKRRGETNLTPLLLKKSGSYVSVSFDHLYAICIHIPWNQS